MRPSLIRALSIRSLAARTIEAQASRRKLAHHSRYAIASDVEKARAVGLAAGCVAADVVALLGTAILGFCVFSADWLARIKNTVDRTVLPSLFFDWKR